MEMQSERAEEALAVGSHSLSGERERDIKGRVCIAVNEWVVSQISIIMIVENKNMRNIKNGVEGKNTTVELQLHF